MEPQEVQKTTTTTLSLKGEEGEGNDLETEEGIAAPDSFLFEEIHRFDLQKETEMPAVPTTVLQPARFAKVEKSLASLGFFTPSSRRIKDQKVKRIGFTREIDGKRVEVSAEIHPSAAFGLPVTADQDKFLALQQIITNTLQSEGKVTNPIRFKSSDILRLIGSSTKTGRNYKSVSEWLDVMSATTIFSNGAVYVAGRKSFAHDRFRVFDRALSVGKEMDDGTVADANYVWLSDWQLENINNKFLVPIDLETYSGLKNHIAKALVPLLQIWLFASHKAKSFEKRYSELCEILALQTYRNPSQILRQFQPSLEELTQHGYIEKWRIEKTSDRKSYKVILFHGPKFHRDRRRRLEQKNHAEPVLVIGESEPFEPNLPEPGKPEGVTVDITPTNEMGSEKQSELREVRDHLVDDLSARGLMPSAVLKLLEALPSDRLDQIPDYIEYFENARKTSEVGPGFLYDLIRNGDPLPATFQTRKQRAASQAAEERRKKVAREQERLKADYEAYCRQAIDRYIAEELAPGEFESRMAAYITTNSPDPEFWKDRPQMADQLARHAVRAEITKGIDLPSFEEFCRRQPADHGTSLAEHSHPIEKGNEPGSVPTIMVPPPNTSGGVSDQPAPPAGLQSHTVI